jgi:hypothetical protein
VSIARFSNLGRRCSLYHPISHYLQSRTGEAFPVGAVSAAGQRLPLGLSDDESVEVLWLVVR